MNQGRRGSGGGGESPRCCSGCCGGRRYCLSNVDKSVWYFTGGLDIVYRPIVDVVDERSPLLSRQIFVARGVEQKPFPGVGCGHENCSRANGKVGRYGAGASVTDRFRATSVVKHAQRRCRARSEWIARIGALKGNDLVAGTAQAKIAEFAPLIACGKVERARGVVERQYGAG